MSTATTESSKPATTAGEGTSEEKTDEFAVPEVSGEEEEDLKASDFRTSDDAQIAFLQGRIDEDTFARVVGRYGKPNNPPYARHAEVDGAYENQLPKWAFTAPEGLGLTVQERIDVANKKAEERENQEPGMVRTETGEVVPAGELGTPYKDTSDPSTAPYRTAAGGMNLPAGTTSSSSSDTSSSSSDTSSSSSS